MGSQLAAEVAMGHSTMQDIKMNTTKERQEETLNDSEGSGGYGEADMQAQMMAENIVNLNQTIEYMMNIEANCDMANENTPMEYYSFVINDFYLRLILTDMTEMDSFWGSVEFGPMGTFETYNDEGVMCLKGTHQRDLMAVQVVLKVYMEMAQLHMAIIHEEMLDMTGECPVGYQLGDWSDDSGECCCDPSYQPPEDTEELTSEPEDGEEPIEIPAGGYGEEPITIGYGGGEEPVLIPSGDGEEPVEIPQGGYGEEPINISGGEEPVVIGGGEEPVSISFGEEPVSLGSKTTMTPSSSSTPIGSRRRGQRDVHMSSTTSGPTGQSPISIPAGYGNSEQPVTVGYGNGEEPVTIENGYGGETPVTVGYGDGEEPVTIDGGEEPVTIPQGEEPVSVDGYGGYGTGEQPMEVTGYGISGEQPMEVTGYGEVTEEPTEPLVTFAPVSAPPRPETKPAAKCFPKKKFCKCRTIESQVTGYGGYGTGGPSVPSGRPTPGPGINPSGVGSTGSGTVPTGEMGLVPYLLSSVTPTSSSSLETSGPTGTIPYLLGSSTASTPLTSQLPYLLTRSTASTVQIGSVPYLLTKTTPSTMFTTTFEGMMPYKLVRSSTPSTINPTNAKKQA